MLHSMRREHEMVAVGRAASILAKYCPKLKKIYVDVKIKSVDIPTEADSFFTGHCVNSGGCGGWPGARGCSSGAIWGISNVSRIGSSYRLKEWESARWVVRRILYFARHKF